MNIYVSCLRAVLGTVTLNLLVGRTVCGVLELHQQQQFVDILQDIFHDEDFKIK